MTVQHNKFNLLREIGFVTHLVKLNLAGGMEYRASFLTQVVGMFINNGIYFIFWIIFFDRFKEVQGYRLEEIFLLFAVLTLGFGVAFTLAGNAGRVAEFIVQGRLDYYLTLPRPVLPHLLFSWMNPFTVGDLSFGLMSFFIVGRFDLGTIGLFLACTVLVATIFVSVFTIFGCLAFFIGNAKEISFQISMSMLSLSMYPIGIFQGFTRLILYTILPAAFIGAVPVEIIQTGSLRLLLILAGVAALSVAIMNFVFHYGLRRYESGSAINVNM
jgi:ABC-2 type transport system permease protein